MYVLSELDPDEYFVPEDFFVGVLPDGQNVHTLLWFNASELAGTKIESANLYLFPNFHDYNFTSFEDQVVEIYKVATAWENATWNTKPEIENKPIAKITVTETFSESANLTRLVQEWADNPADNFGIMLKPKDEKKISLKAFTLLSYVDVNYSIIEEPENECEENNGFCDNECLANEFEADYSCGLFSFRKCCIVKPKFCNNNSICDLNETKESCPEDCKKILESEGISELECRSLWLPKLEEDSSKFSEEPKPSNESSEIKGYILEFKDKPLLSKRKELLDYLEQLRNKAQNYKEEAKYSFIIGKIYKNIAAYYVDYQASKLDKKIPIELKHYSAFLKNNQKNALYRIEGEVSGKKAQRIYKNTFNGVFMDITEEEANSLKKLDFVKNVYPNRILKPLLNESVSIIGAGSALENTEWSNLTGKNVAIAIIDTGIDYTHSDLGGTKLNLTYDFLTQINGNISFNAFFISGFQILENKAIFNDYPNYSVYSYDFSKQEILNIATNNSYKYLKLFLFNNYLVSLVRDKEDRRGLIEINLERGEEKVILPFDSFNSFSGNINGKYLLIDVLREFDNNPEQDGYYLYVYDISAKELKYIKTHYSPHQGVVSNEKVYYTLPEDNKIKVYDLKTNSTLKDIDIGANVELLDSYGDEILIARSDNKSYEVLNTKTGKKLILGSSKNSSSIDSSPLHSSKMFNVFMPSKSAKFNDRIVAFEDYNIKKKFYIYDRITDKFVSFINLPHKINEIGISADKVCLSVLPGVIDTGIYCFDHTSNKNYSIPSFNFFNDKVIGGYDFLNNDIDPMDVGGHGTHVAATAAGNGVLKGVAPDAKIYAYKVCDDGCATDAMIAAIERSVDPDQDDDFSDHVDIISMSIGGPGSFDDPESKALSNAVSNGIVAVVAAGNEGPEDFTISCPGCSEEVITVGASSKNNLIPDFSSRGPTKELAIKPDIVAPGVNICAAKSRINELGERGWPDCLDEHHISLDGTSMATPHVSGAAALLKQAHPEWNHADIKSALILTAVDLGDNVYAQGNGLINVPSALNPPFLVNNSNIFMGEIESSASASLEFKNIKEEEILITFSLSNITNAFTNTCNSIKASLNNYTIIIAPKSAQIVNLSIEVKDIDGIFNGFVIAKYNNKSYKIPYSFSKFPIQSRWFNSDISIAKVGVGKSAIGEKSTIEIIIKNIGERASKSSTLIFEDIIYSIVAQRFNDSINSLSPDEEFIYYLNWTPIYGGKHTLRFFLDTIIDKNQENNAKEVQHNVILPGIDLIASLYVPVLVVSNNSHQLTIAVHNFGNEPAKDVEVKVYETIKNIRKELINLSFDFVNSDEGITKNIDWIPSDFGTVFLEVNATVLNDSDTSNNYYKTEVNVTSEKPDLIVSLFALQFYIINTIEPVFAIIRNIGFNPAENITLELYENNILLNSTQLNSLDGINGYNYYFIDYVYTPTIEGDKLLRLIAKVNSDADYSSNEKNVTTIAYQKFKFKLEIKNSSGNSSTAFVSIPNYIFDFIDTIELESLQNRINISIIEDDDSKNLTTTFKDSLVKENMTLTISDYSGLFKENDALLYNIYAKRANWSYSEIMLFNLPATITYKNVSGSYQMFKCKIWSFEKEHCTTGWEEPIEASSNSNMSYTGRYDAIGLGGRDYDGDNFIDLIDKDDDNDGLNDSVDKIKCRIEKIARANSSLPINFFDYTNVLSSAFQTFWEIREASKSLIEIKLDSKASRIDCRNTTISKDKKQNKNYLIIKGFEVTDSTKTIYMDASENSTNNSMICIKDQEISSISEVSESCKGDNEILLKCDGKPKNGYACSISGQGYKISGLKHSAVIELGPCQESWSCTSWSRCRNGTQTRTCTDPNDCGTTAKKPTESQNCSETANIGTSSSSGSSFNKASFVCSMGWKCGDWSACSNGIQVRGCEYVKVPQHSSEQPCPTESNKPLTTQKCEAPVKVSEKTGTCFDSIKNQNELGIDCGGICKTCQIEQKPEPQKQEVQQKDDAKTAPWASYLAIAAGASVLLAIAIYSRIVIRRKSRISRRLPHLEGYIKTNLALGYPKIMIRQKLLEAGWKNEMVDNILKKF